MKVLVACERSGIVRDAFIEAGHDAVSCDLETSRSAGPHMQQDIQSVDLSGFDLLIAHPPCTYLTNAAARPLHLDDERTADALALILFLATAPVERICIENPVGRFNRLRHPDQIIHPWMFGHVEQKRTCLWLKNLPPLMASLVNPDRDGRWLLNLAKSRRAEIRSQTFPGIAQAMASQWGSNE